MKSPSLPTWTVLPHEPLEQLEDNLWRAVGTLPGMPLYFKTTLTVRAPAPVPAPAPVLVPATVPVADPFPHRVLTAREWPPRSAISRR